jgi:hypothetical protein
MKIEVLHFRGCPSYLPTVDLLKKILREEGVTAEICPVHVQDSEASRPRQFAGSPTILIDGADIEPNADSEALGAGVGLACRWYPGGVPSEAKVRARLRAARGVVNE